MGKFWIVFAKKRTFLALSLDNRSGSCYNSRPQTMKSLSEGESLGVCESVRESVRDEIFDNQVRDK